MRRSYRLVEGQSCSQGAVYGMRSCSGVAKGAVHACRENDYQASAVASDCAKNLITAQSDAPTSRYTLKFAERKSGVMIVTGVDTGQMRENRQDNDQGQNQMFVRIMGAAMKSGVAETLICAVGISGRPAEFGCSCARAGFEAVQDRLDFAD